jgi:tetratricopeptide (TPR) repeat protein
MTAVAKESAERKVKDTQIHREPPSEPYRGIAPFRFIDEPIFFGRECEAEELRRTVLMFRGVLFYGDSGAGKSSLLNARFIPQVLENGFLPNRIRLQPQRDAEMVVERISLMDAGRSPFLPSALAPNGSETPRLVLSIQEFERRVRVSAKKAAEKKTTGRGLPKPLLIFDQFEEFVTLFDMAPEKKRAEARAIQATILDLFVRLLEDRTLPVKLVFTFREDYLAKIEKLILRKPDLVEQRVRLVPPEISQSDYAKDPNGETISPLRSIIRHPLAIGGQDGKLLFPPKFTGLLCDRLETELRGRSKTGFLNLSEIQIVCRELWHSEHPEAVFAELGVDGLLEKFLSGALVRLGAQRRDIAIALLSELVTGAKTRNIVFHDELVTRVEKDMKRGREAVEAALTALVGETGLVRLELRHNIPFYEIISEFLIPWIFELKEERRLERERDKRRRALIRKVARTSALLGILAVVASPFIRNLTTERAKLYETSKRLEKLAMADKESERERIAMAETKLQDLASYLNDVRKLEPAKIPGELETKLRQLGYLSSVAGVPTKLGDQKIVEARRSHCADLEQKGDELRDKGELKSALETYTRSYDCRKQLADQHGDDEELQFDLSSSYNNLGNVFFDLGNYPGALDAFERALSIRQQLAEKEPGSTRWQRSVFFSLLNTSDAMRKLKPDEALARAQQALIIANKLAIQDNINATWKKDQQTASEQIQRLKTKK